MANNDIITWSGQCLLCQYTEENDFKAGIWSWCQPGLMFNIFSLIFSLPGTHAGPHMCQYPRPPHLPSRSQLLRSKVAPFWQSQITLPAHYVGLGQKPYLSSSGSLFTSGKRMFYLTHWFCTAAKKLSNMLFPWRDTEAERETRQWDQTKWGCVHGVCAARKAYCIAVCSFPHTQTQCTWVGAVVSCVSWGWKRRQSQIFLNNKQPKSEDTNRREVLCCRWATWPEVFTLPLPSELVHQQHIWLITDIFLPGWQNLFTASSVCSINDF